MIRCYRILIDGLSTTYLVKALNIEEGIVKFRSLQSGPDSPIIKEISFAGLLIPDLKPIRFSTKKPQFNPTVTP